MAEPPSDPAVQEIVAVGYFCVPETVVDTEMALGALGTEDA
jgi:hypothetical protein